MPKPTPTIGRVVLCNLGNVHPPHRSDPYPATIVGVNQDGSLELNAAGDKAIYEGRGQTNVPLSRVPQGEPDGQGQRWWWPPRATDQGTDAPRVGGATKAGAEGQTVGETDKASKPVGAGAR